jgi:hypothetical protein
MSTIFTGSRLAVIVMSLGVVAATTQIASAKTWQQTHPRLDEVNARLEVQNWRINQALKQGKISVGRAVALHEKDQFIRTEERFEAHQDGSHITPAEQKALNQQENSVSGKIP